MAMRPTINQHWIERVLCQQLILGLGDLGEVFVNRHTVDIIRNPATESRFSDE
jgi:hypothetical protein